MFAYTIIYYINRWNDETTCTQRREIVLCKLLMYILFCEFIMDDVRHRLDTKLVF